jgi:hypothetical protein
MHSFDVGKITFLHNGDFSGDVQIVMPPVHGVRAGLHVPFAALKALVAKYVRQEKISALEHSTDDELLFPEVPL